MSFSESSFILKNDSTLWGCGKGNYGQLGLNSSTYTFTQITGDIKSVYCGKYYTLILKNNGTLWGCGRNDYGQLGLGDTADRIAFTQIASDVKSAYCGEDHTIMLKNDGTLWGCGDNRFGQLGLGDKDNRRTFTQITANSDNIKLIYCGEDYTIALKKDGTLWGCGLNNCGQLGLGDTIYRYTFTQITTNANDVKSICSFYADTFILKNDGTLWGCGRNDFNQLGLGDTIQRNIFVQITNDVKSVNSGQQHIIMLKNDNTLWGYGINGAGQLGLGDTTQRNTLTQITTNVDNVKSIYCGYSHTLILKSDGTLWVCGDNSNGQLGLSGNRTITTFTQITTNTENIKCFANEYPDLPNIIKIYNTEIGYVETLDTNNFRSIPINSVEKLKSLCTNPLNTHLNCLISFDKKQTWKTFDGTNWNTISNISPENIILNGMEVSGLNSLDKKKLISGGFTGDLDFKIAIKTNDTSKTPSVTKIYIEYK